MRQKSVFNETDRSRWLTAVRFLFSLPKLIRLFWRILRDPRVPAWPKFVFGLALVYVISPIDLIPDFIFPPLGYSDDLVLLIVAGRYLLHKTPPEITDEHVREIEKK
jgi:uncharacterized membrane protein YkvA (DUF1232 family)